MSHKIPASVRSKVERRSGGVCESCGNARATEMHHRQYRSRGGKDVASNLVHVCGWGNHTGCHGIAHTSVGETLGLSVRSGFNPRDKPVIIRGTKVWLTDDGRVVPVGKEAPDF